jgi:hypothetical protein
MTLASSQKTPEAGMLPALCLSLNDSHYTTMFTMPLLAI